MRHQIMCEDAVANAFDSGRRRQMADHVWARVLDEADHGVIVVDGGAQLLHTNVVAGRELSLARLLVDRGGRLAAVVKEADANVQHAVYRAANGSRSLLTLRHHAQDFSCVFLPLAGLETCQDRLVLVHLPRLHPSHNQTLYAFARAQGLSATECAILMALCEGDDVAEIALTHGVAESTVRTQIKAIREKTGHRSIRRLIQCAHTLPPAVSAWQDGAGSRNGVRV